MALNATTLGSALKTIIESKIRTEVLNGDPTPYPQLTKFSKGLGEAIAQEVVDHFKNNAELDNATFSGTFSGTVSGGISSTTISNQPVTGGIK